MSWFQMLRTFFVALALLALPLTAQAQEAEERAPRQAHGDSDKPEPVAEEPSEDVAENARRAAPIPPPPTTADTAAMPPPPPPPAQAATYDDVVHLRDGSMLRGTIYEIQAGQFLTIGLPTGERRRIAMSEVSYAGPASQAPPLSQPSPQPAPDSRPISRPGPPRPAPRATDARVQIAADQDGITLSLSPADDLHVAYGRGPAFQRVCLASCEADMPSGTYLAALSNGRRPIPVDQPVVVPSGLSRMLLDYDDNSGLRTFGTILRYAGPSLGGLTAMVGWWVRDEMTGDPQWGLVIGGISFAITSFIVGLILGNTSDGASIELRPVSP